MNFLFSNYSCNYTFVHSERGLIKHKDAACFSDCYWEIKDKKVLPGSEITVYINKDAEEAEAKRHNNWLSLNDEEFIQWIKLIRREFSVKISYRINKKTNTVIITVPDKVSKILFVTTVLRYCYEHPYCYFLKDAFRLKKEKGFTKYSILELFNLVAFLEQGRMGLGHRIGNTSVALPIFLPFEDRKKAVDFICSQPHVRMCHYYEDFNILFESNFFNRKSEDFILQRKRIKTYPVSEPLYWEDGELFDKRIESYRKFLALSRKYVKLLMSQLKEHKTEGYTEKELKETNVYYQLKWTKKYL